MCKVCLAPPAFRAQFVFQQRSIIMRALAQLIQRTHMPLASPAHRVQQPLRLAGFLNHQAWREAAACASTQPSFAPRQAGARRAATGAAGAGDGGAAALEPLVLVIYSKEGCHLCDGLKEKVEALLGRAEFLPCALTGARLEVRDIATNPAWEQAYAMTIPVLAAARHDGSDEVSAAGVVIERGRVEAACAAPIPRPSPRLTADGLQRHIERFLAARGGAAGAGADDGQQQQHGGAS
eukprot:scaffold23.g4081.t1